ncbi:MAG: hypothetical protein EBR02_06990 [Alphaproteobacteria bacterium]|nr:hypothetical protein [Alphaproteobacteria bacterium]
MNGDEGTILTKEEGELVDAIKIVFAEVQKPFEERDGNVIYNALERYFKQNAIAAEMRNRDHPSAALLDRDSLMSEFGELARHLTNKFTLKKGADSGDLKRYVNSAVSNTKRAIHARASNTKRYATTEGLDCAIGDSTQTWADSLADTATPAPADRLIFQDDQAVAEQKYRALMELVDRKLGNQTKAYKVFCAEALYLHDLAFGKVDEQTVAMRAKSLGMESREYSAHLIHARKQLAPHAKRKFPELQEITRHLHR